MHLHHLLTFFIRLSRPKHFLFPAWKHHMAAEMIQTEGLQSSLFAYNALISGCAAGRGYDRAIGYFNDMVSRPPLCDCPCEGPPEVLWARAITC